MPSLPVLVVGLGLFGSCAWIWHFFRWLGRRDRVRRLIDQCDAQPDGGWPRLAVAFAARDEAASVEAATRSLLAQDYPGLEIRAVDDRSADATGAILDRLADEDARLRVVHIRELPDGWLGKTHALQQVSEETDAPWLLLTDADVIFAPGALRRAMSFAVREGADHVTVAPAVPTRDFGERLFLSIFDAVMALGYPIWRVEDPKDRTGLGAGAFNLLRAERFRDIGGFRRLALSVDEDMQLGRTMKAAGGKARLLLGEGAVSVRWQTGLWGLVRGLEKNFFAGAHYRVSESLAIVGLILCLGVAPFGVIALGPPWCGAVAVAGIAAAGVAIEVYGRQNGIRWFYALALPVSSTLFAFTLLRSAWLTLARGGVVWRGHLYPLGALRAHVRHRDAWLREVWRSTW